MWATIWYRKEMSVDNSKATKRKARQIPLKLHASEYIPTRKAQLAFERVESWHPPAASGCPTNMMRIAQLKDLRGHPDLTRWPSDHSSTPKPAVPEEELDPKELILPLFPASPCLNLQWALKWEICYTTYSFLQLCVHALQESILFRKVGSVMCTSKTGFCRQKIWERL